MQHLRLAALGAAVFILAGTASAQNDNPVATYTHGNACTGGGAIPSQYGVYNPSPTASASITCAIQSSWYQWPVGWERWIQVSYYNRSTTPGAFSCKVTGLNSQGRLIWTPDAKVFPTGSVGSSVAQINIGQPPPDAVFFSVSCTLPKGTGAANGFSYFTAMAILIG